MKKEKTLPFTVSFPKKWVWVTKKIPAENENSRFRASLFCYKRLDFQNFLFSLISESQITIPLQTLGVGLQ